MEDKHHPEHIENEIIRRILKLARRKLPVKHSQKLSTPRVPERDKSHQLPEGPSQLRIKFGNKRNCKDTFRLQQGAEAQNKKL